MRINKKWLLIIICLFSCFSFLQVKAENIKEVEVPNIENIELENGVEKNLQAIPATYGFSNTEIPFNSVSEKKASVGKQEIILSKDQQTYSTQDQNIDVIDGKIVGLDKPGYFTTLGGQANFIKLYKNLEDINSDRYIPFSGASFDGIYYHTTKYQDQLYAKVLISGVVGFIDVNAIQILPKQFSLAQTYFTNENNKLVLYEAVDPLTSCDYTRFDLEVATTLIAGKKYVKTGSDQYVELDSHKQAREFNYFKNLTARSTTKYNANDFQRYLASVNRTNSQYYNQTQAFFDGGNYKGINPLLIFAMANHESAYGTSYYARTCNNFYGRFAYDSAPDNACKKIQFANSYDGASAQAFFLSEEFLDPSDWRYYGGHVGDKISGMNVKYASDGEWGAKIAAHMMKIDNFLGNKDYNYFSIGLVGGNQIYLDASCNQPLYRVDTKSRTFAYKTQAANGGAIPVIITQESNNNYKIQLDTAISDIDNQKLQMTKSTGGSFPTFLGKYGPVVTVNKNQAAYVVNYGTDFYKNQGYIDKHNVTILNHHNYKSPGDYSPLGGSVDGPIKYNAYQNNWLQKVGNDQIIGDINSNTGISQFIIDSTSDNKGFSYRGHFSNYGWSDCVSHNQVLEQDGHTLEAIQIDINSTLEQKYDIYYRVYTKQWGWLDWAKNGKIAGSTGHSQPIYAIQVKVVDKNSKVDTNENKSYISNEFLYQTHHAGIGWSDLNRSNQISINADRQGTIEAIRVFPPTTIDGEIKGYGHVENIGDLELDSQSNIIGTTGQSKRLEGVDLSLTGQLDEQYQLYANSYMQDIGWIGAKQNSFSGSRGLSRSLYAFNLALVDKNQQITSVTSDGDITSLITFDSKINDHYINGNRALTCIGTTGESLPIQALRLNNNLINVDMKGHIAYYGWQDATNNFVGYNDNRLEALIVNVDSDKYDFYYRGHVQNVGWQDWKRSGEMIGTTGQSLRLETFEFRLVLKPQYQSGYMEFK